MENKLICLDTSVLIDYYRKKNKAKSLFYQLTERYMLFSVSAISEYEIYMGSTEIQNIFWNEFFDKITIFPFDSKTAQIAVKIQQNLKRANKVVDIPDLLIAATAIRNNLPLATLNRKHFERIDGLQIIM
ncbi:MAG: type II toxin-antitoxin system VapC family toxin [Tannerella sp.]|jgi:predicted nucleic acid-binding protein|nr:type II toxin-antitoxin system VapC family toxin [Tannerella sp.]